MARQQSTTSAPIVTQVAVTEVPASFTHQVDEAYTVGAHGLVWRSGTYWFSSGAIWQRSPTSAHYVAMKSQAVAVGDLMARATFGKPCTVRRKVGSHTINQSAEMVQEIATKMLVRYCARGVMRLEWVAADRVRFPIKEQAA